MGKGNSGCVWGGWAWLGLQWPDAALPWRVAWVDSGHRLPVLGSQSHGIIHQLCDLGIVTCSL